jgi:hypothetical protein
MSLEKYRRARELIAHAGGGDFEGPKPESLVAKAEAALGLVFPPSYRQFLLELGCGDIAGFEVHGIIDEDFGDPRVPDAVALTLDARRTGGPRPALRPDRSARRRDLRLHRHRPSGCQRRGPVVQLSSDFEDPVTLADSFGAYFLTEVEDATADDEDDG